MIGAPNTWGQKYWVGIVQWAPETSVLEEIADIFRNYNIDDIYDIIYIWHHGKVHFSNYKVYLTNYLTNDWMVHIHVIYMIIYSYDTTEINIVNTRFIYYIIWPIIGWFWWRRIYFYWYILIILTLVPQSYQFCRRDYFLRNMIDEGCHHGLIVLHIGAWAKWLNFYRCHYPKECVDKSTLIQT